MREEEVSRGELGGGRLGGEAGWEGLADEGREYVVEGVGWGRDEPEG